jgi:signal transduction histidine kinase
VFVILRRHTLLQKVWLSTSVALTVLFGATGFILQRHAIETTSRSLEEEVKASFQAYESVWKVRAEMLGSVASILSSTPNVRNAFSTRNEAAIRDTAGELWLKISDRLKETSFFLVADTEGSTITSLDNTTPASVPLFWPIVRAVRSQFPKQVSGFFVHEGQLFQLVLTPVYGDAASGPVLVNVLVAGYTVNHLVAQRLKELTGGSDFLFYSGSRIFASTLNDRATAVLTESVQGAVKSGLVSDGVSEYAPLVRELIDMHGRSVGRLAIFRSFEGARARISELRRDVILVWLGAMTLGLLLTYSLARRLVQPIETLDLAAGEVARQNYDFRVPVQSQDEFGRLAATFNAMCASIRAAREELIRHERISTIGRLASSIVHDLRNPLAAIYGGAEMLVDTDLPPPQVKRLAGNIYNASRRIQELLQDLVNVSRGRAEEAEICRLREIVQAAVESMQPAAEAQGVAVSIEIPEPIELPAERARVERVFMNLIGNSLEAMPRGGSIRLTARIENGFAVVEVRDTGPGVSREIRSHLFQPFVTFGKKNGLGLGLALSRQTILDHGGDIWVAEEESPGACFVLRLPAVKEEAPEERERTGVTPV